MHSRLAAVAFASLAALASLVLAGDATPVRHPHFDDKGALSWSTKLADAQAAAKSQDKLIFVEYGRERWSNCKALVQGVLTDSNVKERISKLAVGLAADCDSPESDVQKLMRDNLKGANTLPFVGVLTPAGKWVAGFSGYKDAAGFVAFLDEVEKAPALQATPETTKKLEGLVAQATKAAEKGDWKAVMTASKSSADLKGRSPVREKLAEFVKKARDWAEAEMTAALESVKSGGERGAIRAQLKKVSSSLAGEPEQKDADQGGKALDKLTTIESMPAEQQDAAREKATKDFAGSRWAGVFDKSVPTPAEPAK